MENIVTLREIFSEYDFGAVLGTAQVQHLTIDRESRRVAVEATLDDYVPAAELEAA